MSEHLGGKYRKKVLAEVVDIHNVKVDGEDVVHVKVQNEGHPDDQWLIDMNTFERTYGRVKQDIGWAKEQLDAGHRVARKGWNGKNMWLLLQVPDEHSKMTHPYIYIEYPVGHPAYPKGSRVPWLASQTDMLAEDYVLFED